MNATLEIKDGVETYILKMTKEELKSVWMAFQTYLGAVEREVGKQIDQFNSGKLCFQAEIKQVQENVVELNKDRVLNEAINRAYNGPYSGQ